MAHLHSFDAIEIRPPEDATHSERERPFVYHRPSNQLFYTTQYCHHGHIMPKIFQVLTDQGHDPYVDPDGEAYQSGDITDPDWDGRNWIKFINGSKFESNVIHYLQERFGKERELIWHGEGGWQPVEDTQIKYSATYSNPPRDQRIKEWRWSYDPDLEDLQVWEVTDGFPSHTDKTGVQGPYHCAQGRIYLLKDKVDIFYWKERPMAVPNPEKGKIQQEGWDAAWNWIEENGIEKMIPETTEKTANNTGAINWMWYWAYSPKFAKMYTNGFILANSPDGLVQKIAPYTSDAKDPVKKYYTGRAGMIPNAEYYVFACDQKKFPAKSLLKGLHTTWGDYTKWIDYKDLLAYEAEGKMHPAFLLNHGCFGFINGHLIIGTRHHMEIMYRLLQNGWSWEQLMNADQLWGWFSVDSGAGSIAFSSDAGAMTGDKKKCIQAFNEMFGAKFKDGGGYGGKGKADYGGNMESKYGPIGQWGGSYAETMEQKPTIISPIPPPPIDATQQDPTPTAVVAPDTTPVVPDPSDPSCPSCKGYDVQLHHQNQNGDPIYWCNDCGVGFNITTHGEKVPGVDNCPKCNSPEVYALGKTMQGNYTWKCAHCGAKGWTKGQKSKDEQQFTDWLNHKTEEIWNEHQPGGGTAPPKKKIGNLAEIITIYGEANNVLAKRALVGVIEDIPWIEQEHYDPDTHQQAAWVRVHTEPSDEDHEEHPIWYNIPTDTLFMNDQCTHHMDFFPHVRQLRGESPWDYNGAERDWVGLDYLPGDKFYIYNDYLNSDITDRIVQRLKKIENLPVYQDASKSSQNKIATLVDVDYDYNPKTPQFQDGCFGWVNGDLYLGNTHHALIIATLIQEGKFTWDTLLNAQQMWGWFDIQGSSYGFGFSYGESGPWVGNVEFATDDAKQSYGVKTLVRQAFKEAFPFVNKWNIEAGKGHTTQQNYGERARTYLSKAS
jgi:transposase-like protein